MRVDESVEIFKECLLKREIECLLYDSHQKREMIIMIMETPGSQVDSPAAKGNGKGGERRKMRDLHKDTLKERDRMFIMTAPHRGN